MLPRTTGALVIVSVLIPGDTGLESPGFGAGSGVFGNRKNLIGKEGSGNRPSSGLT